MLLLGYAAGSVSPLKFELWPFAGLLLPYFMLLQLAWFVFWMLRRKRWAIVALLMLGLGYEHISAFFPVKPLVAKKDELPNLTLLSYNVRLFNVYKFTGEKDIRKKIIRLIQESQSQVVCLQEIYQDDTGSFPTLDTLHQVLGKPYQFTHFTSTHKKNYHFGLVTYSQFPIVRAGKIVFPNARDNAAIFTDLMINKDTIRVINAHLQSVHLSHTDYEVIDSLQAAAGVDRASIFAIAKRLKKAYVKRALQVMILKEAINQSPHPVFLAGDFNDTPGSYLYNQFHKLLGDAFREAGSGLGSTYTGGIPGLRIDYIFYPREKAQVLEYKRYSEILSDHFAIRAAFKCKQPLGTVVE